MEIPPLQISPRSSPQNFPQDPLPGPVWTPLRARWRARRCGTSQWISGSGSGYDSPDGLMGLKGHKNRVDSHEQLVYSDICAQNCTNACLDVFECFWYIKHRVVVCLKREVENIEHDQTWRPRVVSGFSRGHWGIGWSVWMCLDVTQMGSRKKPTWDVSSQRLTSERSDGPSCKPLLTSRNIQQAF